MINLTENVCFFNVSHSNPLGNVQTNLDILDPGGVIDQKYWAFFYPRVGSEFLSFKVKIFI